MARINIPKNPEALIKLAKDIKAKHVEDGDDSPLNGLDMEAFAVQTDKADKQNEAADKNYKAAEKATQNRDIALGTKKAPKGSVMHFVRSIRDILEGTHKGNERTLGDWGFEVDDSPTSGGDSSDAEKKA